ncbi:AAA family ATPase [Glacieibacterium sp.]|uniref:AAA family ATPase n=1 Tax=Glacieibacterium sp. TaxID=2860237 RepID=UPI003B0019DB
MAPVPTIHLVCGSTGAGKTTYSLALTERLGGVRFSIDEWMATLFWQDSPQPIEFAWSIERVERCRAQIWNVAAQLGARGVPAILDLGFTTFDSRAKIARLSRDAGLVPQLHFVDVDADERWRRVAQRNVGQGETRHLAFDITREMFDMIEAMWEAPDAAEMTELNGMRAT